MAASGYTPISLYYSTTASAVPLAANLANGELALNTADMKLYAKNSSGTVTLLASNSGATGTVSSVAVSGGTTGLTTSGGPITSSGTITLAGTLATTNGGTGLTSFTANGVVYASSSSALATGSALTFDGSTTLQVNNGTSISRFTSRADVSAMTVASSTYPIWYNTESNQPHVFYVNNSEQMRLTSTGLGIGTSSPVAKQQIKGTGTSGQVTASWILENGSSGTAGMDITGSAGSSYWRFLYGGGPSTGTNALTLGMSMVLEGASAGYVGVGTTSPQAKLQIDVSRTSSTNAIALILNDNVTGAQTNGVYKAIRSLSNGGASYSEIRFVETDGTNNNTGIGFATQNTAGALAQRFMVGPAGQFGIGPVASISYGTAGQVLTSQGSSSAPTWSTPAGGTTMLFCAFSTTGGF